MQVELNLSMDVDYDAEFLNSDPETGDLGGHEVTILSATVGDLVITPAMLKAMLGTQGVFDLNTEIAERLDYDQ